MNMHQKASILDQPAARPATQTRIRVLSVIVSHQNNPRTVK